MIPPYPLAWPEGMPRTARPTSDPFKTSLGKAVQNVTDSLRRLGSDSGKAVTSIVVTSNVAGLGAGVPSDRGIAAWFEWDGEQRCIAVDRYGSLEGTVQAIHHVGIDVTEAEVRRAYDALARTRHPDKPGGSHDAMAELNQARDRALAELKGR
jgi:hypothetical protein